MAKSVNLAEYQRTLSARLRQSAAIPVAGAKLGLEFGGARYLVDVDGVAEVAPNLEVTPVPFVQPWFLGIADIRGIIHGVIDLEVFAGGDGARGETEKHYVVSGRPFELRTALLVRRVLGLRRVEAWRKLEPIPPGPAWITAAYVDEREQSWREISLKALLGHPDFLQIAL
jgi:twitching motility protein PilI